jgi:hypothetical protein
MSAELAVAIVVALIAALASITGAVIAARNQRALQRVESSQQKQTRLQDEQARLEAVADRYKEPLAIAAWELQSRLWNIALGSFSSKYLHAGNTKDQQGYAVRSTLWLLGQYFCWVEILHREVQFLRLKSDSETVSVQRQLNAIRTTFASDNYDDSLRVFRAWQRAIGEKMITIGQDAAGEQRTGCLGYATFCESLDKPHFNCWFQPLAENIEALASNKVRSKRLVRLQHQLLDLLRQIDEPPVRFPGEWFKIDERQYVEGVDRAVTRA